MAITQNKTWIWLMAVMLAAVAIMTRPQSLQAQDYQDQYQDPPDRVARLGYMEGSVSLQPAGESEWVGAVTNRPLTIGDALWADQGSRAEVELGSAVIRMGANTGFSFLNLDDRTTQIQLTAGELNISVRRLDRDDVFEIDTPNQAFVVYQPGRYRVEVSEDGNYTTISLRQGEGESTGNGQNYSMHAGQRWTFSGIDTLTADVEQIGGQDDFDNWAYSRERRYDDSRSAQYVSPDLVGYDDLDQYGDWRDDPNYGHVWYPNQVSSNWAPYRDGHWDWIAPWGWTWVDEAPWGYAPFHYGRWVTVGNRWGWIAGPRAVRPVYAPALVVFIGQGGNGFDGNVGWFPLGPREVYVPSYRVSRGYVDRVNVSNTTVNTTTITNVYNTTIVKNTTNITNVTYVNRNVQNAVTAVPQRTFVSAQPVAKAVVRVNAQQIAAQPVSARVAVAPTRQSVLGGRANTANRVTAPPAAVAKRTVVAKAKPAPVPVPFAKQQQALAQHPGQPLARQEAQTLRPAVAEARPLVKMAPPGKPAQPNKGNAANQPNRPGNQPANSQPPRPAAAATPPERPADRNAERNAARPNPSTDSSPDRPANRPDDNRPTPDRPQPNRPDANRPAPDQPEPNRPDANRNSPDQPQPNRPDANRPAPDRPQPNRPDANRPAPDQPEPNRPNANRNSPDKPQPDRPDANRSAPDRPQPNRPDSNRPAPDQPEPNRPDVNRNAPDRSQPNRPDANRPAPDRPQPNRPDTDRPGEPPARKDRPPSAQPAPDQRPEQNQRQEPNRKPQEPQPQTPTPDEMPQPQKKNPPVPPQHEKPQTPEERKRDQEQKRQQQQQQQQKDEQDKKDQQKPPEN